MSLYVISRGYAWYARCSTSLRRFCHAHHRHRPRPRRSVSPPPAPLRPRRVTARSITTPRSVKHAKLKSTLGRQARIAAAPSRATRDSTTKSKSGKAAPSAIDASARCGMPCRRPSGSWRRNEVDSHEAAPEAGVVHGRLQRQEARALVRPRHLGRERVVGDVARAERDDERDVEQHHRRRRRRAHEQHPHHHERRGDAGRAGAERAPAIDEPADQAQRDEAGDAADGEQILEVRARIAEVVLHVRRQVRDDEEARAISVAVIAYETEHRRARDQLAEAWRRARRRRARDAASRTARGRRRRARRRRRAWRRRRRASPSRSDR